MGFFSNIFENLRRGLQEKQEKRKEEQEFLRRLEVQAEQERKIAFAQAYTQNAKIVAIARAKKDAASKSGLQKLRAQERVSRLQETGNSPGSFFDKFGAYTQKNLVKREENLKRTQETRETAKKMREQKLAEVQKLRQDRLNRVGTGSFGKSWH